MGNKLKTNETHHSMESSIATANERLETRVDSHDFVFFLQPAHAPL